jgi:hypothetical protein
MLQQYLGERKDDLQEFQQRESTLRGRCQCGGRRLLRLCDSLPTPLCNLRTLLRDEHGCAHVPLMGPVAEVAKGEHRNDVPTGICSTRTTGKQAITEVSMPGAYGRR